MAFARKMIRRKSGKGKGMFQTLFFYFMGFISIVLLLRTGLFGKMAQDIADSVFNTAKGLFASIYEWVIQLLSEIFGPLGIYTETGLNGQLAGQAEMIEVFRTRKKLRWVHSDMTANNGKEFIALEAYWYGQARNKNAEILSVVKWIITWKDGTTEKQGPQLADHNINEKKHFYEPINFSW